MQLATALSPYPIFRLTIPLVAGIFLSDTWLRSYDLGVEHGVVLGLLLLLLIGLMRIDAYVHRWVFGGVLYLFLFVLGSFVVQLQWKEVTADWTPGKQGYKGIIVETPKEKPKTMSCKMRIDDKNILLYIYKDSLSQTLRCGDEVLFYTAITPPHNSGNPYEFDYASYLLRKQISGTAYVYTGHWRKTGQTYDLTLGQRALEYRDKVIAIYKEWGFARQELAVLSALTVGYKEDLSDELRESYSVAGISHVLALSGLHVGILWGLLSLLLRPLNRRAGLRVIKWCTIMLILWSYAFVAGLAPSVIRAVVMCMLVELGQIRRSKGLSLNMLAIAAFFMLLCHPFYLFDVGFQLSFMAVLAILLFYPRIYRLWPVRHSVLKYFWGIIAVSIAAQLGTAPLVIYYFSGFPVYFLLANLIIAPLVFIIMYMAVLAFLLSPLPLLHTYIIIALDKSIQLLNGSAGWVSHLPSSSINALYLSAAEAGLLYAVTGIALGCWVTRNRRMIIGLLSTVLLLLGVLSYHRIPRAASPVIVFYNVHDCPAVHFIEADRSSYLFVDKWDSAFFRLQNISRTYWEREKLTTPRLLTNGYESKKIWSHNGITRWHGINICVLADNYWQNKTAGSLLDINYMYLCKGYKGKIAPLQKLFRIKRVVLDASLSAYKSDALREECRTLGIDYIDMSRKGSFHILL